MVFKTLESGTSPHGLHIWVVLPSEELVAAVGPHDILVYRELHLAPEILLLIRSHGQPGNRAATAQGCQERNVIATMNKKPHFSLSLQRKAIRVPSFLSTRKTDQQVCPEQWIVCA